MWLDHPLMIKELENVTNIEILKKYNFILMTWMNKGKNLCDLFLIILNSLCSNWPYLTIYYIS